MERSRDGVKRGERLMMYEREKSEPLRDMWKRHMRRVDESRI